MASLQAVADMFAVSHKIGLTKATFLAYIIPPFVCQYSMGVLVQLEGTRYYRLALLPVMVWFAWRATFVDLSGGDITQAQQNAQLITQMLSMATRTAAWAFARERYQRHYPVHNRDPSASGSVWIACWNTWDLLFNPRGIGWSWPRGLVVPKPAYETESRVAFVLMSAVGVAYHALVFDACVQGIRALGPGTFGSIKGGTMFDGALPPTLELGRAVLVSALCASAAYTGLQYTYRLLAILFVILFHQHPSQWPPLFEAPWLSTSLSELWGRRWHQMMRDMLLSLGGRPFGWMFGRLGGLVGVFLVSGVFHDIELRGNGLGGNSMGVIGFWVMNGVGVVLERVWKRTTGRRVGGVLGWMWTFGWLTLWGISFVEANARVGRFAAWTVIGGFEPSLALVGFVRRLFE
ncbi:hypothetical protein JVU11DRAFT_11639 [Chiua virens]|nr:hypothetical protein JVU11DRAFT_11639 [Chiua virens]